MPVYLGERGFHRTDNISLKDDLQRNEDIMFAKIPWLNLKRKQGGKLTLTQEFSMNKAINTALWSAKKRRERNGTVRTR